jgi:hypothetical protein
VTEPNESGVYEWTSEMAPGEQREAVARYRLLGARSWHYDLGSRRRRVQQFLLEAVPAGPVRFLRGSLQPTARAADGTLRWDLSNVVTAQQVGLAFASESAGREPYLQALGTLPAAFAFFLIGTLVVAWRSGRAPDPGRLAGALVLFAAGLGAAAVAANYLGPVAGMILLPLAGAWLAAGLLAGRRRPPAWPWLLVAMPAALLPSAFLSAHHSGLLAFALAVPALAGLIRGHDARPGT